MENVRGKGSEERSLRAKMMEAILLWDEMRAVTMWEIPTEGSHEEKERAGPWIPVFLSPNLS